MGWRAMLLLGLLAPVGAGAAVPVTGRHQDMTFDSYEVNRYAASAYERILAEQHQAGMLDRNTDQLRRLRGIARRLITQAVKLKYQASLWHWEIHLTSSPDVDAFCMAGGKLLISSHFIDRYQLTDGELATVLAHEIGHALAEHVREQLSEVQLHNPRYAYPDVADAAADMNSDLGLYLSLMPLSRIQEREADRIGIRLAFMAGYPTSAVLSFYRKLAAQERESGAVSFFRSHSSAERRLQLATEAVRDERKQVRLTPTGGQPLRFVLR